MHLVIENYLNRKCYVSQFLNVLLLGFNTHFMLLRYGTAWNLLLRNCDSFCVFGESYTYFKSFCFVFILN